MASKLTSDQTAALKRLKHGYKIEHSMFDRLVELGVAKQLLGGPGLTAKGRKALDDPHG